LFSSRGLHKDTYVRHPSTLHCTAQPSINAHQHRGKRRSQPCHHSMHASIRSDKTQSPQPIPLLRHYPARCLSRLCHTSIPTNHDGMIVRRKACTARCDWLPTPPLSTGHEATYDIEAGLTIQRCVTPTCSFTLCIFDLLDVRLSGCLRCLFYFFSFILS
jgi:hypothetical protein